MNSRELLVASSLLFALTLVQLGLVVLRNRVRSHLFPMAVPHTSTHQACKSASEE